MKNSAKRFFLFLAVVAFGLNWVWEMAQMFAYAEKPAASSAGTFLFCTLASVIDAAVTLNIYALLKSTTKPGGAMFYPVAAILGAACAVVFEWFALRFGLWSYGEQMIVVPFIGIGLLPFVQLTLLVPLAIWLTRKLRGV